MRRVKAALIALWSRLRCPPRPARQKCALRLTGTELSCHAGEDELWTLRWEEVTRVATYKVDLLTVDMICLDFFVGPQSPARHTDDEMQGFDTLCGELRLRYPSIAETWWFDVAFPAFATNGKILYEALPPET